EAAHQAILGMLADSFEGREPDLAEENVQARIRGVVLMALSNKFGWLVLTTGNKSEMAAGFATLYGDMAGGFAVIKDVPKLLVYELCRDRNARAARRHPACGSAPRRSARTAVCPSPTGTGGRGERAQAARRAGRGGLLLRHHVRRRQGRAGRRGPRAVPRRSLPRRRAGVAPLRP